MKLLFLTTYQVPIDKEHYFTKNVWKELSQAISSTGDECVLGTVLEDINEGSRIETIQMGSIVYYQLHLAKSFQEDEKVRLIMEFFQHIRPSVIHSNMIEGYDVKAANALQIPICLTIHIGGFICPRGGGNGFLRYDDEICNEAVGNHCTHCCSCDLPFPYLTHLLYQFTPNSVLDDLSRRLKKNVFYLTPFVGMRKSVVARQRLIQLFKQATIIAANRHLIHLLELNGLKGNVRLIPHGVAPRPHLPFPPIQVKVKLFFLGRIQHSKGLHVLLKALEGIDPNRYELHVIGDAESPKREQRYNEYIVRLAKGKNVLFHGRLKNEEIETVIKDMHLMVFPTIYMEIYGISVAEALSIGRPVLASRCGGSEMQVEEGKNGWLVAPNDVKALHDKLQYLLQYPQQIEVAAKGCTLPHPLAEYIEKLLALYKDLTSKK